jgi:hypothetical protein
VIDDQEDRMLALESIIGALWRETPTKQQARVLEMFDKT